VPQQGPETFQKAIEGFSSRRSVVGIVGLGYVGLPLMLRYCAVGVKVIGLDIDAGKVDRLNSGKSYIAHLSDTRISEAVKSGFVATTDFSMVAGCDALILCVPTPLSVHREPDLSFVMNTVDALVPNLRVGQVISLESTTYPGTTEEIVVPRVSSTGLKVGKDIFVVYSPEREDPGNPNFETRSIPKLVGGHTPRCLEVGMALYSLAIDKLVPMSSAKAAEMTKLLENIHRSVNIGLVNEMKIVADKMGIDIFEVIDAAATKPFGFTAFYPGPGLGGHCIPIDPFYLTWKAREFGVNTRFIELAGEVNSAMPKWIISKLADALNERSKSLKNSKILILGIAYKKNVDDMRESPSVEIMELLKEKGAVISYSDPYVPVFPKLREHYFNLSSVALTPESIAQFDAVVLATNHDSFDYELVQKYSALIIDSRGVYREPFANVVKA